MVTKNHFCNLAQIELNLVGLSKASGSILNYLFVNLFNLINLLHYDLIQFIYDYINSIDISEIDLS